MKKRSERLSIVVDLAYQHECDKAKLLETITQEVTAAERQLDDLARYYHGYAQQSDDERHSHSAAMLQSRRFFLQHLHDAIGQQQQKVQAIKSQYEEIRDQWVSSHTKTENLKDFVGQCAKQETAVTEKQEQKIVDEWSTQRFNRQLD